MAKLTLLFAVVAAVIMAILGGGLYLAYGDFSPPSQPVEKVLPNARFRK